MPFFLQAGQHSSALIVKQTCMLLFGNLMSCRREKKLNSLYAGEEMPINLAFFMDMMGMTTLIKPQTSQKAISSQMMNTFSSFPWPR
jgi:hypothetical protein